MERIWIRGLALFGHHGVSLEERRRGQVFIVDARVDIERSKERDELSATVDYTAMMAALREQMETREFHLLESLAQALAGVLLERFPKIRRAQVRVRKRLPVTDVDLQWVAAETICMRGGSRSGG